MGSMHLCSRVNQHIQQPGILLEAFLKALFAPAGLRLSVRHARMSLAELGLTPGSTDGAELVTQR